MTATPDVNPTLAQLAGTMPDREVAAKAGVPVDAVKAFRREHRIRPYLKPPPPRKRPPPSGEVAAPAPATEGRSRVVRRRGDTTEVVAAPTPTAPKRATDPAADRPTPRPTRSADARLEPYRARMGKVDDGTVAELAGVSRGVVGAFRRKHGIPAYEGYRFQPGHPPLGPGKSKPKAPSPAMPAAAPGGAHAEAKPTRRSKLDPFRDLVGVLSDAEVARRAGVVREAVRLYRRKRGIPSSFERRTRGAAPAARPRKPAPPDPEASAAAAWAWRVRVLVGTEEVVRYAVTPDARGAAILGQRLGDVVAIERVGEGVA